MTTTVLLVLTALVAAVDWIAVARGMRRLELAAKPLTLAILITAASFADLGKAKPWVLGALVLGLCGDAFLLFAHADSDTVIGGRPDVVSARPGGIAERAFIAGLGCFLLGHLSYLVAFTRHGLHGWQVLAGVLVAGGITALVAPAVLRGAAERSGPMLAGAVAAYSLALGAMAALGFGTAAIATAIGALLFLASDTTLGWNRFVHRLLRGPVIVAVTYHLGQILIVVGLIR